MHSFKFPIHKLACIIYAYLMQKLNNMSDLLGQRLREFRFSTGLTQQEVAEKLGVNQATISRIERGKCYGKSLKINILNIIEGEQSANEKEIDKIVAKLSQSPELRKLVKFILEG